MLIDIIFVGLLVMAIFKGYSRGLIVAIFSVVALIIGLAAAMKLSALVAGYLGKAVKISDQWLPIISFAVVFFLVVLLVRWGARLVEKSFQAVMLGWANRIGGIVLYVSLYITILSVAVFYAEKAGFLTTEAIQASRTYAFIQPWGPKAINGISTVLPFLKNSFQELQEFFGGVSEKLT